MKYDYSMLAEVYANVGKHPGTEDKVDAGELEKGIKVEMEHTNDPKVAKQIALDHLAEDPKYYSHLSAAKIAESIMAERKEDALFGSAPLPPKKSLKFGKWNLFRSGYLFKMPYADAVKQRIVRAPLTYAINDLIKANFKIDYMVIATAVFPRASPYNRFIHGFDPKGEEFYYEVGVAGRSDYIYTKTNSFQAHKFINALAHNYTEDDLLIALTSPDPRLWSTNYKKEPWMYSKNPLKNFTKNSDGTADAVNVNITTAVPLPKSTKYVALGSEDFKIKFRHVQNSFTSTVALKGDQFPESAKHVDVAIDERFNFADLNLKSVETMRLGSARGEQIVLNNFQGIPQNIKELDLVMILMKTMEGLPSTLPFLNIYGNIMSFKGAPETIGDLLINGRPGDDDLVGNFQNVKHLSSLLLHECGIRTLEGLPSMVNYLCLASVPSVRNLHGFPRVTCTGDHYKNDSAVWFKGMNRYGYGKTGKIEESTVYINCPNLETLEGIQPIGGNLIIHTTDKQRESFMKDFRKFAIGDLVQGRVFIETLKPDSSGPGWGHTVHTGHIPHYAVDLKEIDKRLYTKKMRDLYRQSQDDVGVDLDI
jgi:hypothetical protein